MTRSLGRTLRVVLVVWAVACVLLAVFAVHRHYQRADRDGAGNIVGAGRVTLPDLRAGDCLDESFVFGKRSTQVRGVPCDSPHLAEVYAITAVAGQEFPGTIEVNNRARAACAAYQVPAAARDYLRTFIRPEPDGWSRGDRRVVCVLSAPAEASAVFSH